MERSFCWMTIDSMEYVRGIRVRRRGLGRSQISVIKWKSGNRSKRSRLEFSPLKTIRARSWKPKDWLHFPDVVTVSINQRIRGFSVELFFAFVRLCWTNWDHTGFWGARLASSGVGHFFSRPEILGGGLWPYKHPLSYIRHWRPLSCRLHFLNTRETRKSRDRITLVNIPDLKILYEATLWSHSRDSATSVSTGE